MVTENLIECYHKLLEYEHSKLEIAHNIQDPNRRLNRQEIEKICKEFGVSIEKLEEEKLLIKYSDGTYRTLHYDIIFRLVNIAPYKFGQRIPLEFKIIQKVETLPDFTDYKIENLRDLNVPEEIRKTLVKLGFKGVSNYQYIYLEKILSDNNDFKGYVISAPTATGKTLIFAIPSIVAALNGERSILIYPRKALASDQLNFFIKILVHLNEYLKENGINYEITIGIDDGDTPLNADAIEEEYLEFRGLRCPLCTDEEGKLLYVREGNRIIIKCSKDRNHVLSFIKPTKNEIWENPPHILVTNGFIVNRRLMESRAQKIFERVKYIILDETHVYKEELGAHMHYCLKRLVKRVKDINNGKDPKIIISSATLPKETLLEFSSKLLGIEKSEIFFYSYHDAIKKSKNKRVVIHLVLLPNPFASGEVLAENVLLFLVVWSALRRKKSIFFVDSVEEVYRLSEFVDELITKIYYKENEITRAIEHLVAESDNEVNNPYYWGHYLEKRIISKDIEEIRKLKEFLSKSFSVHVGELKGDERARIEEEFRRGDKFCLISTSTLELGINIGDVSIVAHYRYPLSNESYVQRVGRAGRSKDCLYVTLSILILNNSPSQLRFLYGENDESVFELPPDYSIPLPIENEIIRESHNLFEVLDILAKNNKPTFISLMEVRKLVEKKNVVEIIDEIINTFEDAKKYAYTDKNLTYTIEKYTSLLKERKELYTNIREKNLPFIDEEIKLRVYNEIRDLMYIYRKLKKIIRKFKNNNLDKSLKEKIGNYIEEIEKTGILTRLKETIELIEKAYQLRKSKDIEILRDICMKIGRNIEEFRKYAYSDVIHNVSKKIVDFRDSNINILEPKDEELLRSLEMILRKKLIHKYKTMKNVINHDDLMNYFLGSTREIEKIINKKSTERYKDLGDLNIINLLNLLGDSRSFSLLFSKPIPTVNVVFPSSQGEEVSSKTIDQILQTYVPLRVFPRNISISELGGRKRMYYTFIYGISGKDFKVIQNNREIDFLPLEGGEEFPLFINDSEYRVVCPIKIYAINLNENILECKYKLITPYRVSKKISGSITLGHLDFRSYNLNRCRFCSYGILITSRQVDHCIVKRGSCPFYIKCYQIRNKKPSYRFWNVPNEPYFRTSYFRIVKVHPRIYNHADEFEDRKIIETYKDLLSIEIGKGSVVKRAIIECSLIPSGDIREELLNTPTLRLREKTLGYSIVTNGICFRFKKEQLKKIIEEVLRTNEDVFNWIALKYHISRKYFNDFGDIKLSYYQDFFEKIFNRLVENKENRNEVESVREIEEVLKEYKEKNFDRILNFSLKVFLHSISHLLFEFIVEILQTNIDNLIYYFETDRKEECRVYILENAEKGLGLTETLYNIIQKKEKSNSNFSFLKEFFEWSLRNLRFCDELAEEMRVTAENCYKEKIKNLNEDDKENIEKIRKKIVDTNNALRRKYYLHFPIDVLRIFIFKLIRDNRNQIKDKRHLLQFIPDIIQQATSYCWDGCYHCVRIERGCNYDPYRQMVNVSKNLLRRVLEKLIKILEIPVSKCGKRFDWILEEFKKTEKELRICSPWISKRILEENILPLIEKGINVKIVTRDDLENPEQRMTIEYLKTLSSMYKNLSVKFIKNLHAKIYIIDSSKSIKGSFNLTYKGLYENIETGEEYTDRKIVEKHIKEFEEIFNH